jgi:hypothetical protein
VPPTVLAGNFFPNPTFEQGVSLDNPTLGIPSGGWNRGGSSSTIDQMSTVNSVSHTHALALVDTDANNYGEWYVFLNLSGLVSDNDAVDIQWFQLYNITNGAMRLSFAFLDSGNNTLFGTDNNVSGQITNWSGSLATSPFQQQNQRYLVPVGTTQLRVNLASGGATSVTGLMLIDDLSVRLSKPQITAATRQTNGFNVTWNSMPSKNYTVSFTSALGTNPTWTPLVSHFPGATGVLSTSYLDTLTHAGKTGFYRIVQE